MKPAITISRAIWCFSFPLIPVLVTLTQTLAAPIAGSDISGTWQLTVVGPNGTNFERIQLKADGDKISGKHGQSGNLEGTLKADKLEIKEFGDDKKLRTEFSGNVQGDTFSGIVKLGAMEFNCSARRQLSRPSGSPTRHNFEPTKFHRHFSGAIPPALTIFPGDTVHTDTVGADGVDKNGIRRSQGGNPLSGPFYVEGALSGDTLVVHFKRVRLNRDTAISGSGLVPTALEPWYIRNKQPVRDFDSTWHLDRERGVATLAKPTEKLKNFTVPLRPMVGCIGVAPPGGQSFLSGDLGPYGGNLDYNQLSEGTTVYLPVFQPGALLFVGDGHAAQGDGELTGDALETSMEVEFTVDLIQGKSVGPRAENDEYIMALGVANSMPEAVQRATTQLATWLEDDYKLNPSEVAMVLGFAIRYDVAELVDPHVHMVAKIKKSSLAGLGPPTK
jgi:amidase